MDLNDEPILGLHDGLVRYLLHGIRPGGFLCAVLSNNLQEAIVRCAWPHTPMTIDALVRYFLNGIPSPAWGSPRAVDDWCSLPSYRCPIVNDFPVEDPIEEERRRHR